MDQQNWTDIFMAVAIAAITLGIGFNLKFKDFRRVIVHPKAVLTGLSGQLIGLPLLAIGIVFFWPMEPIFKVGFILIAACPGGSMSNFVTYILKGRVPLSVSMTAFNSFLILLSIPLYMDFAYWLFETESQAVNLSFMRTFKEIMLTVILPVIVGIVLNESIPEKVTEPIKEKMRYFITAILLGMVLVVMVFDDNQQAGDIFDNLHLLLPLFIFNLATIFAGFLLASGMKLKIDARFTIAIEMGLQNSALAIFIASKILENEKLSMLAILYGSFSLFTTWIIAYLLKYYSPAGRDEYGKKQPGLLSSNKATTSSS